jgi:hypothetical protein
MSGPGTILTEWANVTRRIIGQTGEVVSKLADDVDKDDFGAGSLPTTLAKLFGVGFQSSADVAKLAMTGPCSHCASRIVHSDYVSATDATTERTVTIAGPFTAGTNTIPNKLISFDPPGTRDTAGNPIGKLTPGVTKFRIAVDATLLRSAVYEGKVEIRSTDGVVNEMNTVDIEL